MANVHDVASYILERQGGMTTMKLQKLIYYSQAWSLVWDGEPLFENEIEAWVNGPVVREIYNAHAGQFRVGKWMKGDSNQLSEAQKTTIESVLNFYGPKEAYWLSELTHQERPWKEAREGLSATERGNKPISLETMHWYYSSL